jgi:type I restriction enzyme, S subunit
MQSEWNNYTLDDIVNIIGGGTPKRVIPEYWNGKIPWLSVVDFNTGNKHVSETKETITDLGLQKSSTKLLNAGQLIISARGTVGALAQLDKSMAFNQSCYGLDAKIEYTINDFLYYLVKKKVRDLQQITHGAVFDTITKDTFKQVEVQLPSLPTQKKIAHILSTLDDKIELNRKMNQTLEEMAQALFKSWFVDFDPVHAKANCSSDEELELAAKELGIAKDVLELFPSEFEDSELGMIPKGWSVKFLSDIVLVNKRGFSPKYSDTGIKVINQRCVRNHNVIDEAIQYHNPILKKVPLDVYHKSNDILINSMGVGTLGRVSQKSIVKDEAIIHSCITIIRANENEVSSFILGQYFMSIESKLIGLGIGTTGQTSLKNKELDQMQIIVSDLNVQQVATELLSKYRVMIDTNLETNKVLSSTRDTLLPNLLSGEIDVSELELDI